MFKVQKNRVFKAQVTVEIPSATEADKVDTGTFIATFRALSRTDFERMQTEKHTDRAFLSHILVAVEGIGDDSGPYPPEVQMEMVVEDINLSAGAVKRFLSEYVKERAGN